MKSSFVFVLLTLTAVLSACSGKQVQTESAAGQTSQTPNHYEKSAKNNAVKEVDDGNTIVCKKRRPTGSRIPEKQCMTKDGWQRIAEASKNARDKLNKPAYNTINSD